jgi:hypothetical protein
MIAITCHMHSLCAQDFLNVALISITARNRDSQIGPARRLERLQLLGIEEIMIAWTAAEKRTAGPSIAPWMRAAALRFQITAANSVNEQALPR